MKPDRTCSQAQRPLSGGGEDVYSALEAGRGCFSTSWDDELVSSAPTLLFVLLFSESSFSMSSWVQDPDSLGSWAAIVDEVSSIKSSME